MLELTKQKTAFISLLATGLLVAGILAGWEFGQHIMEALFPE